MRVSSVWSAAAILGASLHSMAAGQFQSVDCNSCCAGVPSVTGFSAPMTVGTSWEDLGSEFVVHAFDVSSCGTQLPGPWSAVPRYEHPAWTRDKLGTVFGVTIDRAGNIYVAHTSIFVTDHLGSVGGGSGVIYKLDSATGVPSIWAVLPNSDPCAPASTCGPGLGNLTYSCDYDCIYCSNFEDGRIYRISMAGVVLETYDFGDQAIETALPDTSDAPGLAPFGKMVWAVAIANGRMYFSVVRECSDFYSAALANEVWSIPLTATGAFGSGTSTLEITVPPCTNCLGIGSPFLLSNPVSDIAFDSDCCMYLAERTMYTQGANAPFNTQAHQSRLLKFCRDAGAAWTWSGQVFDTGQITDPTHLPAPSSSAGGVGIDNATCNLVWATSDYLTSPAPWYYGIIGLPTTGGTNLTGLFIDMNGDTTIFDKTFIGSVEVVCTKPCYSVSNQKIYCATDGSGTYTWTFTLTNNSAFSAKYVTIPLHPTPSSPITLQPNAINLLLQDGSLLDPGESTVITVSITGGNPGDAFCIQLGLVRQNFLECCFDAPEDVCLTLPDCTCGQLRNQAISSVYCNGPDFPPTVTLTYCFTLDNLSSQPQDQVIFIPEDSRQGYFVKDFFFLPPLQPGHSENMCVQIVNARPGEQFCFYVLLQHPGDQCCCAFEKCITVPECPSTFNPCDFNSNGVVDGQDLGVLLGSWGPCAGCPADINHDGVVDGSDLGILLGWWGPQS